MKSSTMKTQTVSDYLSRPNKSKLYYYILSAFNKGVLTPTDHIILGSGLVPSTAPYSTFQKMYRYACENGVYIVHHVGGRAGRSKSQGYNFAITYTPKS